MAKAKIMPKSIAKPVSGLLSLIGWVTGVLVALAVGFGMIDGVLSVRFIPDALTVFAGWVVVILTIIGAIMAIVEKVK